MDPNRSLLRSLIVKLLIDTIFIERLGSSACSSVCILDDSISILVTQSDLLTKGALLLSLVMAAKKVIGFALHTFGEIITEEAFNCKKSTLKSRIIRQSWKNYFLCPQKENFLHKKPYMVALSIHYLHRDHAYNLEKIGIYLIWFKASISWKCKCTKRIVCNTPSKMVQAHSAEQSCALLTRHWAHYMTPWIR